jgi:hypothetical protein
LVATNTLDDTTTLSDGVTTWASLKLSGGNDANYPTTNEYIVLSAADKTLVDDLRAAQAAQGDDLALTPTGPGTYTDSTTLSDGTTIWASLKLSATDAGYDTSSFTTAELHLFNALLTAQTAQGAGVVLADTPYSSETTCEIVDTEITYDPKYEYLIEVHRSQYRAPWTFASSIK